MNYCLSHQTKPKPEEYETSNAQSIRSMIRKNKKEEQDPQRKALNHFLLAALLCFDRAITDQPTHEEVKFLGQYIQVQIYKIMDGDLTLVEKEAEALLQFQYQKQSPKGIIQDLMEKHSESIAEQLQTFQQKIDVYEFPKSRDFAKHSDFKLH